MGFIEIVLLAVGLSMDAFAVSVCKGLAMQKCTLKQAFICGAWFGGFQALMPTVGYLLGGFFAGYIQSVDHWIAFLLLLVIGVSMIREARTEEEKAENPSLDIKTMFLLAVATSIDALAVGVSLAFLPDTNIVEAAVSIGLITCVLSCVGVKIGHTFGVRYKKNAELAGGMILILLGLKILLEHLGIL